MKRELTAERLRELLHYDPETGAFTRRVGRGGRAAGTTAGRINRNGYLEISIDARRYKAHRLAWLYMTGGWPIAEIDHIDLNKIDNRFLNLRQATHGENNRNRRITSRNTCGLKGASWHKRAGRWQAHIKRDDQNIYLGLFDSAEEAHAAYAVAAVKLHGEFARRA